MNGSKSMLPLLALLCALPAAAAAPVATQVSGSCSYEGKTLSLRDGLAWREPADDDEGGSELHLVFTDIDLDENAVWRAEEREDAVRDQVWGGDATGRLQLTLDAERNVTSQFLWLAPGTSLSFSSNTVGEFTPTLISEQRVEARYKYADDDGPSCQLSFRIPVLGAASAAPPPPGQALPAGGGEPGAAFLAMNKAVLAGDVEAMLRLLPAEQAAQMRAARGEPDFGEQLEFMQMMTPSDVRVVGGRIDGDRAWIEYTGKEGGQPRLGTAEMLREGGKWRMVKDSTRDP